MFVASMVVKEDWSLTSLGKGQLSSSAVCYSPVTSGSGVGMIVSLVTDLTGAAIGMSFCISLATVMQSISPHIPSLVNSNLVPQGILHIGCQVYPQFCH